MIHGLDLLDTTRAPLARLNSSGLPIRAGQVHKVWRGLVQVEGCMEPSVPVVLKWMSGEIKAPMELACSLVGAEVGLPVPRGVMVLAKRDQLPTLSASAKPLPGTDDFLCYGSALQWPDDSAARLLTDDKAVAEHLWKTLCDSSVAAPGAAWDELAANADRHTGNFVFDGTKHWFIDHELALQPIARMMRRLYATAERQLLMAHQARANILASELAQRHPMNHGMHEQPVKFGRAEQRMQLLADRVRTWQTGNMRVDHIWPMTEIILRGIILRLPALALMLNRRLNVPDGPLEWNSSKTPPPS